MSKAILPEIDTRAPEDWDKKATKEKTKDMLKELDELQNLLYAEKKRSLLIVIQGMDAAGKDGLINDVFTYMNPQGVSVKSFKTPTDIENAHDFLWRIHQCAPEKGMIQVFNRSHYEDILITRVHKWCSDDLAKKRMQAINDFERLLTEHNNTTILKLYLHISHEEQLERLNERMENPRKMWKYNKNDFSESKLWDKYMRCYEDAFRECDNIPWHIIPSDQNWYKCYLVASLLRDTMKSFNMKYPEIEKE